MPKVTLTANQRLDRAFLAALRYGQTMRGEKDIDTSKLLPRRGKASYYRMVKEPSLFALDEIRVLAQRYKFTDRQVCEFIGIEYHGSTSA